MIIICYNNKNNKNNKKDQSRITYSVLFKQIKNLLKVSKYIKTTCKGYGFINNTRKQLVRCQPHHDNKHVSDLIL